MKEIISINDNLPNRISFYHMVLFVVALPFDQFYSQIILISFTLHTFFHVKKNAYRQLFRKETLLLMSVFFLSVLFTISTNNPKEAFSLWTRQLAIFLFPLLLVLNSIDVRRYAKRILIIFALTCTLVILYLYIDAARIILYYRLELSSLFSPFFINHNFSAPLDIHATYLSLYIFLSAIVFIHYGLSEVKPKNRFLYFLPCVILLAGLIQLGSKSVLIALILVLVFLYPLTLEKRMRSRYLHLLVVFSFLFVFSLMAVASLENRLVAGLKADLSNSTNTVQPTDSRMQRWNIALDLVETSPLIGYGTGDEVDILKERYFSAKLYNAYLNNLNTHNQYLSFLLMGGLPALLIYLYTLYYGLRLSIQSKNIVFLSFIVLLIIVSLSENFLFRNKGIFFYSFFFSFFVIAELTEIHRKQIKT